jgi:hypothetical protein
MKYTEDQAVKQKIDNILRECVSIFANLGTNTSKDLKTKEAAKEEERRLLDTIKDIDEEFYHDRLFIPRSEEKEETNQEQES